MASDGIRARFGVISDPHLYDAAALGAEGEDFEACLAQDPKLLVESLETFDAALADLAGRDLDFLLVCGDLTKDGERSNHELAAARLERFPAPVFVIPGNHDLWNPGAASFLTSPPTAVAQAGPEDFERIYARCGFGAALHRDPHSLSYLAEPVPGLWLLALDSCEYQDNPELGASAVGGSLSPETLAWALRWLDRARKEGRAVLGMLHHALVEHFPDQARDYPDFVLSDHESVGRALARAGLGLVFTGHFHANHIARRDYGGAVLHDCQTGSTVTAPCPYRVVELMDGVCHIETAWVREIPSRPGFEGYQRAFLRQGLVRHFKEQLLAPPHRLEPEAAELVAPLAAEALMAHYAGDARLTDPKVRAWLDGLIRGGDPVCGRLGSAILAMWDPGSAGDNAALLSLGEPSPRERTTSAPGMDRG